ncbi:MAG: hypothetical protein WA821_22360 [Anaerolineales bacterium]
MKQPNKPKTDNFGWILALLFPKKSKPPAKPVAATPPAPTAAPVAAATPPPTKPKPPAESKSQPGFQPGKLLPAFWTISSGLSVIVNVILIVVIVILVQQLFSLKKLVGQNLIGGLYTNFILMDQAHIKSNIVVEDTIPVQFNLPISQQITVTLTSDTVIHNALVGVLSGPTTVTLPAGTRLPIQLDLTVPVNTTIPIKLNVPVDIALEKTDLHKPFIGLQNVLSPYYWLLQPGIKSASDLEACKAVSWFCDVFFAK